MWVINLKIAIRSFFKDKIFSVLNLLGLSIGMAACLAIMQFVRYEYAYDKNSPFADDLWRVYCETVTDAGAPTLDANTHSIIGPSLKTDLPEVVEYARLYNRNEGDVIFLQENSPVKISDTWMTDPGFLKMFPQRFLEGNEKTSLVEPYTLLLTASAAKTIFGKTDVLGKTIEVPAGVFGGTYTISAVVADPMPNTHLKFNALVSYATRYAKGHEDNWSGYWEYNYFQTLPGSDPKKIEAKLAEYSKKYLKNGGLLLRLQPYTDIHLHSDLTYEIEANSNARTVNFMALIAGLILLIAFFNYINMMTAKAMTRAKEVGLRKVVGAGQRQLVGQFLMEGALLNSLALLLALAALPALLVWFGKLADRPLLQFFCFEKGFILTTLGVFIASVLVSCLYPAIALSAFRPVQVMKRQLSKGGKGHPLRNGLVVFQFSCSVLLIIAVTVVGQQLDFLKNHDLGLSLDQMVAIKSPELDFRQDTTSFARLTAFQNTASQMSGVQSLTMSNAVPGLGISTISGGSSGMAWANDPEASQQAATYRLDVGPEFFQTYNIEFLSGGTYEVNSREAIHGNVILNEAARRMFGFPSSAEAIGEPVAWEQRPDRHIIVRGVVADFHIEGLQEPARPTLYYLHPRLAKGFLSLKIAPSNIQQTMVGLQTMWSELFPLYPFESWFLDENFARQYQSEQNLAKTFRFFALLAIIIACLGLFGLSTFTASQRTKEIGIRKVLGATTAKLISLLSKDFLKLVVIALFVASPLAYYFMENWLQDFAYRIDIQWYIFAIAGVVAVGMAFLTVGFQSVKAALANPVESLRNE